MHVNLFGSILSVTDVFAKSVRSTILSSSSCFIWRSTVLSDYAFDKSVVLELTIFICAFLD